MIRGGPGCDVRASGRPWPSITVRKIIQDLFSLGVEFFISVSFMKCKNMLQSRHKFEQVQILHVYMKQCQS
jgi:hypothetical protein